MRKPHLHARHPARFAQAMAAFSLGFNPVAGWPGELELYHLVASLVIVFHGPG